MLVTCTLHIYYVYLYSVNLNCTINVLIFIHEQKQFNVLTNHNFFDHEATFWLGPAPCHAPHSRTQPTVEQHHVSRAHHHQQCSHFTFYSSQPPFRSTSSSSSYSNFGLRLSPLFFIVNRLLRCSPPGRSHLPTHREDSGVVTSQSWPFYSSSLIQYLFTLTLSSTTHCC